MVYEGTNEIQAIDLVQRKLLADEGRALNVFLRDCEAEVSRLERHGSLAEFANALREQVSAAREGFEDLKSRSRQGREALLAVSEDAMAAMSHLAMAWAFAARARALVGGEAEPVGPVGQTDQTDQTDQTEDAPLAGLARCRYGVQWLLPQAKVHWQALKGERALPGLCP
jgi:hypothetical protein